MILAVMQPYLFPYIGYYQLAYHSDMFIFYDDVNYIKKGYINRNNIVTKNGLLLFTLPINNASQNKMINELYFIENTKKILSTIKMSYSKSKYFDDIYPIIEKTFNNKNRNVANIASNSIIETFQYLGVNLNYDFSSRINYNRENSAQEKIYELCKINNADKYVNAYGGMALYDKDEFKKRNIELGFINSIPTPYTQVNSNEFIKNASMIDILMNCSKDEIINQLNNYTVI
ncbi:WbqC family protein [Proteus sp. PR00174]|uniref:WbqC family protein n=1 Tax=Proteus TaxID=583 RepID=UPI0018E44D65|nr:MULTISPECIES: WbqC family protein [Proteus]MBI6511524.1 WbqC family protein [Proteus sp. PR00174]MDM3565046.1 WbqC family protein [Proteus vulgaris]